MASLVPQGAWDTHIHVLDPVRYPYITPRYASPAPAPLAEYPTSATGCTNIVVVHASMQGPSRASLLDTLSRGPALGLTLRGIASIDNPDAVDDAELDALHAAGVRGTRLYLTAWGQDGAADAEKVRALSSVVTGLAARFARLGWVIVIVCPLVVWVAMADVLRGLDPRVRVVADHFAGVFPGDEEKEGFGTLLDLLREKKLFVKLSAFDRLYERVGAGIDSLAPIAKAFIEAGPDQILFGSDWPHVGPGKPVNDDQQQSEFEGFRNVSDENHIRKLREWIVDDETWYKLFVTNPRRLFVGDPERLE